MARQPELIEAQWLAIVRAAAPLVPPKEQIVACLRDYRALASRHVRVEDRDRWQRIAELSDALGDELFEMKRRTPWTVDDPDHPQSDLKAVREIQYRAEKNVKGFAARLRSQQSHGDKARERLYMKMFAIWCSVGGKLTMTTSRKGPPRGPLIDFMLTVTGLVMDPPPTAASIRTALRREQRWRKKGRSVRSEK
jgi:hypothetical protein